MNEWLNVDIPKLILNDKRGFGPILSCTAISCSHRNTYYNLCSKTIYPKMYVYIVNLKLGFCFICTVVQPTLLFDYNKISMTKVDKRIGMPICF